MAIGGPGLPKSVVFRQDMKEAGIANVGATVINLLGYEIPDGYNFQPSLLSWEKS